MYSCHNWFWILSNTRLKRNTNKIVISFCGYSRYSTEINQFRPIQFGNELIFWLTVTPILQDFIKDKRILSELKNKKLPDFMEKKNFEINLKC